jgi:DNA-binding CsgD family transcriptional regulator
VFRPLTHVARTSAYVVAPIVRDGHTIGLLHADHFGAGRELDELDRELLWTFATGVGWAMDDIAGRGLRRARHDGDDARDEPLLTAARIGATELDGDFAGAPGRLPTLTARELEVLHLMSEGASNAAIGEALVISQATVKSHVRHILRKLGAANRTEAVSLFLATGARRPASASA